MLGLVAALFALLLPATTAHAQQTVAEIEAQIDELWAELEPMIEEHNAARMELDEKQEQADRLAEKIAPLQLKVDRAMAEVGDLAAYTYKGGHASAFNALLSTGSPSAFADQLLLLDQFSRVQQEQLAAVIELKDEYEEQKAPLDAAIEELTELEERLAKRAEEIDEEVDRLQELRLRAYGEGGQQTNLRPAPCPETYLGGDLGKVLKYACDQIGKPYQWGAAGPGAFDCSGLTMMAWRQAGIYLPHNAAAQRNVTRYVQRSELRPGDLVFYSGLSHVGMYVGGGWIVHAPRAGEPVQMRSLNVGTIHSYGRPG